MSKASGIDAQVLAQSDVSPQSTAQPGAFIKDAIYRSETPYSYAQDVTTTQSSDNCIGDPIAEQVKMSNEQQLAFRCKAYNAAKPNTDTSLPGFQAGEIE